MTCCAWTGELGASVDAAQWRQREIPRPDLAANQLGVGRELFSAARANAGGAEYGAMMFGMAPPLPTETV